MSESFTFPNTVIEIRNALDQEIDSAGRVTPVRLPRWTRAQYSDPGILSMARMGSGVRLRFRSSATELVLNLRITRIFVVGLHTELAPAPYQLKINDKFEQVQWADKGNRLGITLNKPDLPAEELVEGESEQLVFTNLAQGMKDIEIWLPASTSSALESISANAQILEPNPIAKKKWVHYGSSISQCGETSAPASIWPVHAAEILNLDIFNLGLAGQCHLDGFVARTIAEIPTDYITLKLGINVLNADSMRERAFVPAIHNFLDIIRAAQPVTPIMIISPIWCPFHEETPGPSLLRDAALTSEVRTSEFSVGALTLKRVRILLQEAIAKRADPHLSYLDGLSLFDQSDAADLPDNLHPNDAGYQRMGKRFAALVGQDMKA
jgi:lysophospholipase L1-like esterase